MPSSKLKRKIRPFRKVPVTRIRNPSPEHVYLESKRQGVKIPLENENGLLQGVFETPDGKILEIRFLGDDALYGPRFEAFVNQQHVGTVVEDMGHRIVRPDFRGQGIGTALFDRAERHLASSEGIKKKHLVNINVDIAEFLRRRGWKAYGVGGMSGQGNVFIFEKQLKGTQFDNARNWHRIKVLGMHGKAKGKPLWLTIKALQVKKAEHKQAKK
ncbi:MAG TPA: GNAT family N-acetyltransferase [archaeon]|nr:GNAT family N-acetyltransferase [archaeon]